MAKRDKTVPLTGPELVKEVCRLIRLARVQWDAHNNAACRRERSRALALYNTLTPEQKDQIPQVLRVWLRYRSEKYFGFEQNKSKKKRSTDQTQQDQTQQAQVNQAQANQAKNQDKNQGKRQGKRQSKSQAKGQRDDQTEGNPANNRSQ
ncbi:hypothetical protein [Leptolyngbya sp. FACHB-261]|uniref:hypothetical protein n=1 Tax=Leptolyngbya sp. FACHB-261 TaxID=2692806 RepID=UPI001F557C37|nr:hypothetical protein [Leptolyngbya sp. FACHB-261]